MKSLGKASKRKLAFGRESLKDDVIHRNIDGDGDVHAVCGCNIVSRLRYLRSDDV